MSKYCLFAWYNGAGRFYSGLPYVGSV